MSDIASIQVPNGTTYSVKDKKALRAAAAAPEFSASTQYYSGSICAYDGEVYRATQSHMGAWNASHFSKCSPLQEQIDAMTSGYSMVYVSSGALMDNAINNVVADTFAYLYVPSAREDGKARDFYVRICLPETRHIVFEANGASWDCSGINPNKKYEACSHLLHFLEVEANVFHVTDISAIWRMDKAIADGIHVKNPSTGLWHKLVARDNGSGYITLGVEQIGVASWPECPCGDSSGSTGDSDSSSGANCDGAIVSYYEGSGYMMGYYEAGFYCMPGGSQEVWTPNGGRIAAGRRDSGEWYILSCTPGITIIGIRCGTIDSSSGSSGSSDSITSSPLDSDSYVDGSSSW